MSSNRSVNEIIRSLGNSKPIFIIDSHNSHYGEIQFTVKDEYQPNTNTPDPIEKIISESYAESLSRQEWKFETHISERYIYRLINLDILNIYDSFNMHHYDEKRELFKWLKKADSFTSDRRMENEAFKADILSFYRYAVKLLELNRLEKEDSEGLIKKFLNVLTLIRKRYG